MSKTLKIYMVIIISIIGCYGYATYNGNTFWEDKVEKNTEYNRGSTGRVGGYGAGRFYHK